jgi:hypothetical protein
MPGFGFCLFIFNKTFMIYRFFLVGTVFGNMQTAGKKPRSLTPDAVMYGAAGL